MAKLRGPGPDVFHAADPLPVLQRSDIDALKAVVESTTFKRNRICVHAGPDERLQEMFIVQSRATYIRPHKHLDKVESLLVLEGSADAVFFDDAGVITQVVRLEPYESGGCFFYRIGNAVYHSLVIHTDTFIFKEATLGPFDRASTQFAPWSPEASDAEAARAYTTALAQRIRAGERV